ncbi:MAG: hypothetical protein AAGC44_03940 [Planctomycetota bacterium]
MTLALEQAARELFQRELQQRRLEHQGSGRFGLTLQASPVSWLLPRLLRLVLNNTDRTLEDLEPLIRTMLREQFFASTGGQGIDAQQLEATIDETVSILLRTFAEVRNQAEQSLSAKP